MASGCRLYITPKKTSTAARSAKRSCMAVRRMQGFEAPRGFRLKTSMTGGQQYWPEVWAMAAAWREQLGDGEAGTGRLPARAVG